MTALEGGKAVSVSSESLEVELKDSNNSEEDLDNSCLGKTTRILKTIYKGARSLVGLVILLLLYAVLGAFIMMLVESSHEETYKSNITNLRETMVNELLLKSSVRVVDSNKWKAETVTLLEEYERSIRDAIINDVTTDSTVEVWSMWSSLFFVFTVFTTIGRKLAITNK